MDILHLVDRLEETVKRSRRVPFSALRLVDERRVWALIDQMRISVPEEVRRAQRINQERDRILAQARGEAEQLVRQAESRAVAIRDSAEREAAALRTEADAYVFNALCQLEEELRRTLRVVENGLRKIQAERSQEGTPSAGPGAQP
jgi:cell division septum initiation protein DivIVA